MLLHFVPLTPSTPRLLAAIIIALIAALISACGDTTGPRITDMQSRSAAVPGECVHRAFGSVDGGQPSSTSSTAGSCEPYDCREGWFGHIERDPYDCTMYPTTCLSDGGGEAGTAEVVETGQRVRPGTSIRTVHVFRFPAIQSQTRNVSVSSIASRSS